MGGKASGIESILERARQLSFRDMLDLNTQWVDEIKSRRGEGMAAMREGKQVRYIGNPGRRLPFHASGLVKQVGSRRLTVDFGPHGQWRVTPVAVEVEEGKPGQR